MKQELSFLKYLKQFFFLKKKAIQLKWAIRLCDLKQQAFNKRYFVILDYNDKLISLSKDDINRLKRMRLIDKRVTHLDLMEKAFYYTPLSKNNDGKMTKEEREKRKKTYMQYVKIKNKL
jgi:hypothetical protein